ncbi:MAG TPA: histidine kinase [Phycisphaerales bacterium]|nr:histidine kinase [Phycisphaerales bacterium]HMP37506.1 histidine kinase [Phycisphaerales bacterium]
MHGDGPRDEETIDGDPAERGGRSPRWGAWGIVLALTAFVAVALPVAIATQRSGLGREVVLWWLAFGAFVVGWAGSSRWRRHRGGVGDRRVPGAPGGGWLAFTALQSIAALVANWAIPTVLPGVATSGVLLVVVAAQLGGLRLGVALPWIGLQSAGLLGIYVAGWSPAIAWTAASAYFAFQLGMLGFGRLAERERALREELATIVADLRSTRALLASSIRDAERVRISRELHDLLGHHLVALGLQLDAAALESGEPARSRVLQARALARLLLADVRAAVSDLRAGPAIDLAAALRALEIPGIAPRVVLRIGPGFIEPEAGIAAVLLRCAQEAVTNARRHAGATCVEVELRRGERPDREETLLVVGDDGRGVAATVRAAIAQGRRRSERGTPAVSGEVARPVGRKGDGALGGRGLAGMRERLAEIGGTLEVRDRAAGGIEIVVAVPDVAAASHEGEPVDRERRPDDDGPSPGARERAIASAEVRR